MTEYCNSLQLVTIRILQNICVIIPVGPGPCAVIYTGSAVPHASQILPFLALLWQAGKLYREYLLIHSM